MKATSIIYSRTKPVKRPFQQLLPLKLKNSVSGKSDKIQDQYCLQELTILLSCLKENEFNQNLCFKEVNQFQNCYKSYLDNKSAQNTNQSSYDNKKLDFKQINKILKKYPTN